MADLKLAARTLAPPPEGDALAALFERAVPAAQMTLGLLAEIGAEYVHRVEIAPEFEGVNSCVWCSPRAFQGPLFCSFEPAVGQ